MAAAPESHSASRLIDQGARGGPVKPVVCGWTFQPISAPALGGAPGISLSLAAPAGTRGLGPSHTEP